MAVPDQHRDLVGEYLRSCAEAAPRLRWVSPESLHVTLRFLGWLAPGALPAVAESLRQVPFEPFTLGIGGLGTFGLGPAARVVWIGLTTGREPLDRLAAAVDDACLEAGARAEERPYNAHLTLARAREGRGVAVRDLPRPPELQPWAVDSFALYQSRPGPSGAVYTVLERFGARSDGD